MDLIIYKYLIDEIQQHDRSFASLPSRFVTSSVCLNSESLLDLQKFLYSIINGIFPHKTIAPQILSLSCNYFSNLFYEAHIAIFDVLTGTDPVSHQFRRDGIRLVKFLSFCAKDDGPFIVPQTDTESLAMFCFLLEGLMYAEWRPDAFEGYAKRAAHSYFAALKKTLHHLQPERSAAVLGYLWGAWLLASKTEGIRNTATLAFSSADCFEWSAGGTHRIYIARKSAKTSHVYLVPKSSSVIPHPMCYVSHDGLLGLFLHVNNDPVRTDSLMDFSEIIRKKISGYKFIYSCRTDFLSEIGWTVALLWLENTMYRIDYIKLPDHSGPIKIKGEIHLENVARLDQSEKDYYLGKGDQNTVIRFMENPLKFRLVRQEENGIVIFSSDKVEVPSGGSIKCVTAWSKARGITAIQETKLLGIYE